MRRLASLLLPGGLLVAAAAAFLRWAAPETVASLLHVYPYAVFGAGVLLGWRFHRSSVIFLLLALALADRALLQFVLAPPPGFADPARVVWLGVALLLPLNFIAFSIFGDRGSLASRFGWGLGMLAAQAMTVAVLAKFAAPGARALLEQAFLPDWLTGRTVVGHPALCSFALAALFLGARALLSRKPLDNGFFWALLAAFLAIESGAGGPRATIYFSTGGLILAIALIEAGYAMAYRDELTRLPGRRALNEAFEQMGDAYAVAMVDVDHFKKFNDTFGHKVGDQVLQMVAARLDQVAGGGRAFRYGGEEFSILFPGKTVEEALPHLEAVRAAIEESRFTLRGPGRPRKKPKKPRGSSSAGKQVSVTVSIGVAEPSARAASPDQVIQAADKALYRAKKGGRNQVRT